MARGRVKPRGPKVREKEIERMLELFDQGKSFKEIAKQVERHWQTVEKYVREALATRRAETIRREALKEALVSHFMTLVGFLQELKARFVLPSPEEGAMLSVGHLDPDELSLRERLLFEGLRYGHATGSPLWRWIEEWKEAADTFASAQESLRKKTSQEASKGAKKNPTVSLSEAFERSLSNDVMRGALGWVPQFSDVLRLNDSGDELWVGQSMRLAQAPRSGGVTSAQDLYLAILKAAPGWSESGNVRQNYANLLTLRTKMVEEMEVLTMRGAFPGRCRLCPF